MAAIQVEQRKRAESERKQLMTRIYSHNAVIMSPIFRQLTQLEIENRSADLKEVFANFVLHHNTVAACVTQATRADQDQVYIQVERTYTKVIQAYTRRMESLRCEMYVRVLPLEPTLTTMASYNAIEPTPPNKTTGIVFVQSSAPLPAATATGTIFTHQVEPTPPTSAVAAHIIPRQLSIPSVAASTLPPIPPTIVVRQSSEKNSAETRADCRRDRSRSPHHSTNATTRQSNDLRHRIESGIRRVQRVPRQPESRNRLRCNYCGEPHPMFVCKTFLDLTITQRRQEVDELALCTNCLQPSHNANDCARGPCRRCKTYHNSVLCNKAYY